MKFRTARHTQDIAAMLTFYRDLLGLEVLGSFQDHDEYDGVFLGFPSENWEIEFTVSREVPVHTADPDDLLVFYCKTQAEYEVLVQRILQAGITAVAPKNPYWEKNGTTFTDPDGFRVVISVR